MVELGAYRFGTFLMATKEKCPTCGTTAMHFDPPVEVNAAEACGVLKPGNYSVVGLVPLPVCQLPKGHEGEHLTHIEYIDCWGT